MKKDKMQGLQQLVALHIIELRKKKNILQKDLANQIGLSQKNLSLIENGCVDIPLSMLERFAVVLKEPVECFLLSPQNNEAAENIFVDRLRLLNTIDKNKVDYILSLLDIFIDNE